MKTTALTLALGGMLCAAIPAHAGDLNPYVGIDIQRTNYSYNDDYDIGNGLSLDGDAVLSDSLNGVNRLICGIADKKL